MATFTKALKELAVSAARRHGVFPATLAGVWKVESGFDPSALGDLNADGAPYSFGLGQLHVKGAGHGYHPRKLLRPEVNADVSARYLAGCIKAFPDSLDLGISAYNQGIAGAKEKGLKVNKGYVDAVLAAAKVYGDLNNVKVDGNGVRTYTVKKGDNLWKISQRFYGDGRQWETIYQANVKVIGPDPDLIQPGQVLTIP